jgi:catechol 2,3-dioxygenase-like lactoylglutathione lyase family enzyme
MKPVGILEAVLSAENLDAVLPFYRDIVELPLHASEPGHHLFFRCGASMVLVFNPSATENHTIKIGDAFIPRHGSRGPGHLCFRIPADAVESWRSKLVTAGVPIESEIIWPGGGHSLYVRDPAGNSIEFATAALWQLPEN